MYIQQLYTNCLAEAAYYIESAGQAAIIDPLRDIDTYIALAAERGAQIKYVLETHFHADFVSGHIDLAHRTGAKIVYGPAADAEYDIYIAHDGEVLALGDVSIQVLHTPGHTQESSCYLLLNQAGKPEAIFTGDTLFVGDVGRPDLAVKSDFTERDLAGLLFDSLQKKIKNLPDDVVVYPGHGPGSACGKNIGTATVSTIGDEKKFNHALQHTDKNTFVDDVTSGLTPPPQYFFKDAAINKQGYANIDEVMERNAIALDVDAFVNAIQAGALVLDTRNTDDFEQAYIPNAINIGLNGTFAVWVGSVLDIDQPLVVVAEQGREAESILRLARVGYENVKGYLSGGMQRWKAAQLPVAQMPSVDATTFSQHYQEAKVLDVRKAAEFADGYVPGAINMPLADLPKQMASLDKKQTYYVHCAGGYRSMAAASLLKAHGFEQVINVRGGINKIRETGLALRQNT